MVNMNKSQVMQIMLKTGKSSISFIQNKLKISYYEAVKLMDEFNKHNHDYQTLIKKD